ncbi:MAG: hypothetical protein HQL37_13660 [Alphaproteobacteria bacterium]|nr:hypothetical protein [Alphaproteobacteria bacterium]
MKITTEFSPGVAAEIEVFEKSCAGDLSLLECASAEEYMKSSLTGVSSAPASYAALLPHLRNDRPLTILDVGVGVGQSSVFLASKGHTVFSIEPVG